MKNIFLFLAFNLCILGISAQDSASYYSINSLGREIGDFEGISNELYLQSLHGYKFNHEFGVAGGLGFIYYENLGLMPLLVSIRKSPHKNERWGLNFDIGYVLPLFGETDDDFKEDFELIKGGSYFNPEVSRLVYDGNVLVYFNIGYRAYTFTEQYNQNFFEQVVVEDRITRRFINIGVSIEL